MRLLAQAQSLSVKQANKARIGWWVVGPRLTLVDCGKDMDDEVRAIHQAGPRKGGHGKFGYGSG